MPTSDVAWGVVPRDWFQPNRPIVIARAPGRLDVMGGIADYSGATVLELPLTLGALVAAQECDDGLLSVRSGGPGAPAHLRLEAVLPGAVVWEGSPDEAPWRVRAALEEADALWAAYILGALGILAAAGSLPRLRGLRLFVWSDVPAGAGVSSSAALEVATLRALQALLSLDVEPLALAVLAQQTEHRVALAPCGIMDQMTALLGRAGHLLMLRCQPAQILGHRLLPPDVHVVGIDSGVAHRVAGDQYGRVRAAAFMGRAIIAAHDPTDPPGGYLCNLAREHFMASYAALLPESITGMAFLERYGETGDTATRVTPEATYRVRACTAHPIFEQANVEAFLAGLERYEHTGEIGVLEEEAGAAMYRSHESYSARCGLGTPETDLIVDLVRERGPAHGLYGAKITGGGAGGTVAVLGAGADARVHTAAEQVAAEYARRSGNTARVITGSGPGALEWPAQRVMMDRTGDIHEL